MEPIDDIEGLIGSPLEVTEDLLKECQECGQFGAVIYELYKEAGRLVLLSSAAYMKYNEDTLKFERNQAICAGLLVRMSKLMLSVVKLSADIEHGETVEVLNRCILESAVNLMYLLDKDDDRVYHKFVRNCLVAERELYYIIQGNVEARGGEILGIEQSMLRSINDTLDQSGVTVEEVDPKAGSWGGSLKDRLTAIGMDPLTYTIIGRMPSHAIHGDWVDLFLNHLLPKEDGFEPNWDHLSTDGKLLAPIAVLAARAAQKYLTKYFEQPESGLLYQRLECVQEKLMQVEFSRSDWQVAE